MTVEGVEKLKKELSKLKTTDRQEIIVAIKEAREKGDLKENAEYHAAREQQSFIEGRIKDIEAKLSNVQVIDITKMAKSDKVIFSSTVDLINLSNNKEVKYKIVGEDEADLDDGKISITSPLARILVGKNKGDVVELKTPNGTDEYEIKDVKYI